MHVMIQESSSFKSKFSRARSFEKRRRVGSWAGWHFKIGISDVSLRWSQTPAKFPEPASSLSVPCKQTPAATFLSQLRCLTKGDMVWLFSRLQANKYPQLLNGTPPQPVKFASTLLTGSQPTHSIPSSNSNSIETALQKSLSSNDHPALGSKLAWRGGARSFASLLVDLTSHILAGSSFLSWKLPLELLIWVFIFGSAVEVWANRWSLLWLCQVAGDLLLRWALCMCLPFE